MGLIIGYTCVGVFVATAVLTILDLARIWPLPQDVRKTLYRVLIVEVVVICVGWFASVLKLNPEQAKEQISTTAKQQVVDEQVKPLEQRVAQLEKPKIYIRIAEEYQRPIAQDLAGKLGPVGFNVQGAELVTPDNVPKASEVRFFASTPEMSNLGQKILDSLKEEGVLDAKLVPSENSTFGANFEVWLSHEVDPSLSGFVYAVAVETDNDLKAAQVHLREMLLDKNFPSSFVFRVPNEGFRAARVFKTREQAEAFLPIALGINKTVDGVKQLDIWCGRTNWNRQDKYFLCTK